MDKRIIHGQLMNEHRIISNEIADIKASSFELSKEQKQRISELEIKLKVIAQKLYTLYLQFMDGYLIFFENQWVVKNSYQNDNKVYPIWEENQEWINKPSTKKILKDGVEVVFDIMTSGEYSEEKQQIVKTEFAKIKAIYFESL